MYNRPTSRNIQQKKQEYFKQVRINTITKARHNAERDPRNFITNFVVLSAAVKMMERGLTSQGIEVPVLYRQG
jgi:hypothetical protein